VMVPLVCIFSSLSKLQQRPEGLVQNAQTDSDVTNIADESTGAPDRRNIEEWQALVEKSLRFFEKMNHWSAAAKKSRDVVSRLYEASKILASQEPDQRLHTQAQNVPLNLGAIFDGQSNRLGTPEHAQLPVPGSEMITEDIWGLSPNGAAAMNNFWFDDMMWDVPVTDTDMFGNAAGGFAYSEFDWMAGLNAQGTGDQTWQFQQ
jgi:hypothetical protein